MEFGILTRIPGTIPEAQWLLASTMFISKIMLGVL